MLRFEFACFCLCDDQFATQETSETRFCVFQFSIWQFQCCLGIAVPQSLVSMPRVPSPQVVLYCRHLFIAPPSFISNRIPPFIRISSPRPLDAPSVISRETRSNGIPRESIQHTAVIHKTVWLVPKFGNPFPHGIAEHRPRAHTASTHSRHTQQAHTAGRHTQQAHPAGRHTAGTHSRHTQQAHSGHTQQAHFCGHTREPSIRYSVQAGRRGR